MAITIDNQNNKILIDGVEILSASGVVASNVVVTPHGTITDTNLQLALEKLADKDYRSTSEPVENVQEGDRWYNPDTNQLKVYRETSPGVFEFVPIMIGNISDDSDTLDAGGF